MSENKDAAIMDLLKDIPTARLIHELRARNLTVEEINTLQALRPAEQVDSSQIVAAAPVKEVKDSAEKFVNAVVRRNVHGKLPAGSRIVGAEIERGLAGGFYDHGPDQMRLSPLESYVGGNHLLGVIYHNQDKLPDLVNSHVVSVTPSVIDQGNMVLTIHFFQDKQAPDSRGYYTPGHVSAELPSGVMSEFLGEISKNPDLLEDFYQKTFVGLDSQGESPGMRRAKADGFFLINGAKLEEAGKIRGSYDTRAAGGFFSALGKHQYRQGPYGTGVAFQPR